MACSTNGMSSGVAQSLVLIYDGPNQALRAQVLRMGISFGDRFSRLVAVRPAQSRNRPFWLFLCDCGELTEKAVSDVRLEKTRSCGCLRRELAGSHIKAENLIGLRFGRLSPIELLDKSHGKSKWKCLCSCGNTSVVAAGELKRGSTVSCGCYRAQRASNGNSIDISGRSFGRLTAIKRTSRSQKGVTWLCSCSCGAQKEALVAELVGKRLISCGCATIDKPGLSCPTVNEVRVARNHARRALIRGAGGSFTAAQVSELIGKQNGRCANCKVTLVKYHRDHREALANGGDNSILNIEILCPQCNLKKNNKDEILWANQNGRLL